MAAPLIGAPFKNEVRRQLQVRSKKRASQNLTDKDLAAMEEEEFFEEFSDENLDFLE